MVSSTVGLAQQWDQLDQLGMRMQHNLEQQIQARNQSGVSEDALKEFSMMFKYVTINSFFFFFIRLFINNTNFFQAL